MRLPLKKMKKILVFIIGICTAVLAHAQNDLSLSQAIELGLQRNYNITIEQKRVQSATINNNWGEAGRWPSINLNFGQSNSLTDNIQTASPFQLQDKIISNNVNPSVTMNWTLFNGFKVDINKSRLEQLQAESEGNADIVISNTIQAIILGYYRVVLEKDRLREFKKQLDLSRDKYEYTRVKTDLGSAVSSDLLLEENNYLNDSTNYINQQLVYRRSLRNLNVVLAEDDPTTDYNLTDELTLEMQDYQLDNLYSKLSEKNIDLKTQYLTQSISRHNTQLAKSDRYPTVSLNAGINNSLSRVDLSNATFPSQDGTSRPGPADPLTAVTGSYSANFTISFTLFNGGRINRAIQNAIIQEDIANVSTKMMELSLYRDLADALDQYNIRKQLYGISERRLEAAQQNLDIANSKFRNGTINSFDFRVVQINQLLAAIDYTNALYNLIESNVTLMRLTGGIIETYK